MVKLFDDYFFIDQACYYAQNAVSYRFLSMQSVCALGQNDIYVRFFSFVLLGLTAWINSKTFFKEHRGLFIIFVLANSMFIFPIYYASLLSMSFVLLWSSLLLYLIVIFRKKTLQVFLVILMGAIGVLIRKEAIVYLPIFFGSYAISQYLPNKDKFKNIFHVLNKRGYLLVSVCFISYIVFDFLWQHFTGAKTFAENFYPAKNQYPTKTFIIAQVWSSLLYIRNSVTPIWFSFYGNFMDWYVIHSRFLIKAVLIIIFMSIVGYGSYVLFITKKYKRWHLLIAALFCSFLSSFLLGALPRTDWYYLTRQLVGNLFLLIFLFKFLLFNKRVVYGIIAFFLFSSLFHFKYHFNSIENFYKFEKIVAGNSHPYVYERMAHEFIRIKNYERALEVLREGFQTIPYDSLQYSQRTYYYWLRNTYKAFMIGKVTKKKDVIRNTYRILTHQPNFFALIACLQVNIDYRKCSHFFTWKQRACYIGSGKEHRFDLPLIYTPAATQFFKEECHF